MNKAICGSKESAAPHDELETWKETVLVPTLARYSPNDIYNGDETALFYKSLPHRTYCFDGDKPAGSAKRKDRLTLLIITNMDGSDHRKLSVIGKSKTPRCLQKKYKMQVKDMSVDWYASKNAWMTGEIHHQIMTKLNNEMRLSNRHILYVCDNASSHQVREYSHIKFLMLPPNATSIMEWERILRTPYIQSLGTVSVTASGTNDSRLLGLHMSHWNSRAGSGPPLQLPPVCDSLRSSSPSCNCGQSALWRPFQSSSFGHPSMCGPGTRLFYIYL